MMAQSRGGGRRRARCTCPKGEIIIIIGGNGGGGERTTGNTRHPTRAPFHRRHLQQQLLVANIL